jgi:hypothetical protein
MDRPICGCCNSDEFVVYRRGGGYRCERCKTIWDEKGALVGPQSTKPCRQPSGLDVIIGEYSYQSTVSYGIKLA